MINSQPMLFAKIQDLLLNNPSVHLSEVARMMRADRHKIQSIVSRMTSNSFRDFQNKCKMRLVIKLIDNNKLIKVGKLAAYLNYKSPEAFSRFIRQMTGLPPKKLILAISTGKYHCYPK